MILMHSDCLDLSPGTEREYVDSDWKHKLRAAALLALQRREEERKKRELADVLRDLARRDAEKVDHGNP